MNLSERYSEIRRRIQDAAIAAGRDPRGITLVAVSKTKPAEAIEQLYKLGHRDFGENYVQELVEKASLFSAHGLNDIRWHFIGHLQTNKVKALMPWVHAIHSVDSEKLADELAKRWQQAGREGRLPVFLEVNVDDQPSKTGVPPVGVATLANHFATETLLAGNLHLRGLMCIPDPDRPGGVAGAFRQMRALAMRCHCLPDAEFSMGMTQDFEAAIAEGATHIRVGTAIFGEREKAG